jgi:hypothetical protein
MLPLAKFAPLRQIAGSEWVSEQPSRDCANFAMKMSSASSANGILESWGAGDAIRGPFR